MNSAKRILALCFLFALAVPAFASKEEDAYNRATQAAGANRIEEAANLFCEAAKKNYKDSVQMCKIMTDQVNRERQKSDERFNGGVSDFNAGRYDDAQQKFQNVRVGSHVGEAQDYLRNRIPQARANAANAANAAQADAAMNKKFDEGVQAYQNNDFNKAKSIFSQITGKRASEAQAYVNKINQYNAAMDEGDRLFNAGNYKQAAGSYTEAANLKGDGPGDPRNRAARATQQGNQMASNKPPVNPNSGNNSSSQQQQQQQKPPVHEVVNAVKEDTKPKVDINAMLKDAEAARKKGDVGAARGKYLAVLSADPNNAAAQRALEELKNESNGASNAKAGSEADFMLARAIREFYQGKFDQSEVHIQDYLDANGSKTSLGYFYLGASKLTRYYLGGEQERDKKLMKEAQEDFKNAKKTPGFAPPKNYVSPKIVKVFEGA